MQELINLLRKLDRDLLRDHKSNTFNIHKIGNVTVVVTWTIYMAQALTDSVEMWFAYSATLLGASALQYGQKRRSDRLEGLPTAPPEQPP